MTMSKNYNEIAKEVRQKKELLMNTFLWLLASFCTFLFVFFYNERMLYFYIVLLGWGIVVLVHFLAVNGIPFLSKWGKNWEEKEIRKRLIERGEELPEDSGLELKELRRDRLEDDSDFV